MGRSALDLGVGDSRAGPSKCWGADEEWMSCCVGGGFEGDEAEVGDRGAPNADINDKTMQGIS